MLSHYQWTAKKHEREAVRGEEYANRQQLIAIMKINIISQYS